MTLKLNGTNSVAAPAYAGDDADTGLQCGTNELKLVTGGTARAIVDSSGNIGVGTSQPAVDLHLASTNARLRVDNTGSTGIAALELIGGNQTNPFYVYTDANRNLIFQDNAAERARILSGGGLTFNGDTAAANALSDYEEGTWTPTTAGDSTGVISNASGFYTKIGNTVVCSFSFTLVTNFTNSDVGGLPFTPKDIGPNFNGAFVQTTADRAFVVQNHNSKLATLKISNGTYPAVTNSTRCTITYLTD